MSNSVVGNSSVVRGDVVGNSSVVWGDDVVGNIIVVVSGNSVVGTICILVGVVRSNIVVTSILVGVVRSNIVVTSILIGVVRSNIVVSLAVVGVVASSVVEGLVLATVGQGVVWDRVLHLSAKEDLGEGEADRVAVLIEVLVLPLCLGVHNFVMDVLSIDNEVMLNMEDEVPWVCECLGHLTELVKVGADGGLAFLELVGNVMDNMTKVLNSMKHRVEGSMLKLVLDATKTFPDVFGITEALDTVRNFSLDGASKETLKDLAHAEESEVDVRALHGLEVVHLLVLLMVNLVEQLLPVVVKIVEEFLMVDHLGLAVQKHG